MSQLYDCGQITDVGRKCRQIRYYLECHLKTKNPAPCLFVRLYSFQDYVSLL